MQSCPKSYIVIPDVANAFGTIKVLYQLWGESDEPSPVAQLSDHGIDSIQKYHELLHKRSAICFSGRPPFNLDC